MGSHPVYCVMLPLLIIILAAIAAFLSILSMQSICPQYFLNKDRCCQQRGELIFAHLSAAFMAETLAQDPPGNHKRHPNTPFPHQSSKVPYIIWQKGLSDTSLLAGFHLHRKGRDTDFPLAALKHPQTRPQTVLSGGRSRWK